MHPPHLATGSEMPAKADNIWRLYSMHYCPYAHRAKLILNLKNIPFEIVNINLINKPEWYFAINPEGQVPALDTGSQIIVESVDICDYINDKFPDPPLYPLEPVEKEAQREIINKFGGLTSVFGRIIHEKEQKSATEWLAELAPHLEYFETKLENVGGAYFGGDVPNMVDFMIWPWAERSGIIAMILNEKLPMPEDGYRRLRAWKKTMRMHPVIESTYIGPELYLQAVLMKTKGLPPDYDSLGKM